MKPAERGTNLDSQPVRISAHAGEWDRRVQLGDPAAAHSCEGLLAELVGRFVCGGMNRALITMRSQSEVDADKLHKGRVMPSRGPEGRSRVSLA